MKLTEKADIELNGIPICKPIEGPVLNANFATDCFSIVGRISHIDEYGFNYTDGIERILKEYRKWKDSR